MPHLGYMHSTTLKDARTAEREIRSLATDILNRASTRQHHPTYGITLKSLRDGAAMLEGMVRMYAVLTGQANFWSAPVAMAPRFLDQETQTLVAQVALTVRSL